MSGGGVDWGALVAGARLRPVTREIMTVCREPVIKLWWEVWEWDLSREVQWMDITVVYECDGEGAGPERRTRRMLDGLTLMSAELAPGYAAQERMEVSYRTANRGYHGRVRVVFVEDDPELFAFLERGLAGMRRELAG